MPRHWWGKLIGGVLGMLKGGLWGAVFGMFIGHLVDRLLQGFAGPGRTRAVFFQALFGALGHVCKADGRVSQREIEAAEGLMRRLELGAAEREQAIAAFNAGKSAGFDLGLALREFVQFTVVRQDLRQMFMEILLEGAAADGRISPPEQVVLTRAAVALHIPPGVFAALLHAWGAGPAVGGAPPGSARPSIAQDLAALGLKDGASDADIKRAYRKLVAQYHPDRLVSRGLPEEMMEKARERVRQVNAAYDRLKQARGIK